MTDPDDARIEALVAELRAAKKERFRRRMSAFRKKAWTEPGYRARMRAAQLGRTHSAETRARISAARKKAWTDDPRHLPSMTAEERKAYNKMRFSGIDRAGALNAIAKGRWWPTSSADLSP